MSINEAVVTIKSGDKDIDKAINVLVEAIRMDKVIVKEVGFELSL